jgi:hypothetical protein
MPITKNLLKQELTAHSQEGVTVVFKLEAPVSRRLAKDKTVRKIVEFSKWMDAPDQQHLDLTVEEQVVCRKVTFRMDKPGRNAKQISCGFTAEKLSEEDKSTLYNLFQGNKPVEVIVREKPEPRKRETSPEKSAEDKKPAPAARQEQTTAA